MIHFILIICLNFNDDSAPLKIQDLKFSFGEYTDQNGKVITNAIYNTAHNVHSRSVGVQPYFYMDIIDILASYLVSQKDTWLKMAEISSRQKDNMKLDPTCIL